MKKILITGGAGYIGSHTALDLLEKNYSLIIVDSLINSSYKSLLKINELLKEKYPKKKFNLEFVKADIRDKEKLSKIFSENNKNGNSILGVIHLAGLKSVTESINFPLKYWDHNFNGTMNILKIMDKFDCRRMVFSSSASIYGVYDENKLTENSKINPLSPYASTKAAIEKLLDNLSNQSNTDWQIVSLRYFNPIGAHDSGLIGENIVRNPNNIFPIINNVALGKQRELSIYGNDWPTHDGTCIRDYIHIMDLAEGHSLAFEYMLKNKEIKLTNLNIGTGNGTSVLELINKFQEVNKIKVPYIYSERRPGDSPIVVANNEKAKKLLNWTPKRDLSSMCIDGWRWQKMYPNGY